MNKIEKWPSWIKGGAIGCASALIINFVMPDTWPDMAFMPYYVSWFMAPAIVIGMYICMLLHLDFISNNANIFLVGIIFGFSLVFVMVVYGCLVGWVCGRLKCFDIFSFRTPKNIS